MSMRLFGGTSTPMIRAIYSSNRLQKLNGRGSALPLLVARIGTNHTDDTFATNDLAILTKLLNRCAHFHTINYLYFHNDTPFRQVVGRHFQVNSVPGAQPDKA